MALVGASQRYFQVFQANGHPAPDVWAGRIGAVALRQPGVIGFGIDDQDGRLYEIMIRPQVSPTEIMRAITAAIQTTIPGAIVHWWSPE